MSEKVGESILAKVTPYTTYRTARRLQAGAAVPGTGSLSKEKLTLREESMGMAMITPTKPGNIYVSADSGIEGYAEDGQTLVIDAPVTVATEPLEAPRSKRADEGAHDRCASCGKPATPGDPVLPFLAQDGWQWLRVPTSDTPLWVRIPRVATWYRWRHLDCVASADVTAPTSMELSDIERAHWLREWHSGQRPDLPPKR